MTTDKLAQIRVGKCNTGRLLDGKLWDQRPEGLHG